VVNIKTLLPDLKKLVQQLDEDLLTRATENAEIDAGLREAFAQIVNGGRTAQAFEVWREDYLDQVGVAWVLACVFVRFMEDNRLIEECWLAGEGERRGLAEDTHELFFRKHPHETDREYFHHVFHEVGKIPAAKDLFAEGKTPLWAVSPSGDAAMKLLAFWREIDAEQGHLKRSFEVERGDTRFLGDLYQELSEKAKKKFALLQTPVFVEEFILDRTLNPAIDEFGLDTVRMIDPTCGSGHFLLGGFGRLFDLWMKRESNEIVVVQKALDGVWGVDINPFAVAIGRFRLIVAAVHACGIRRLKDAPGWTIHLETGDSLLFGSKPGWKGERVPLNRQGSLFEVDPIYAVEDQAALREILGQGYHVVVGNPPYITVKDKAQNEAYRSLYSTCHRQYSLGVPFTQRFWELAIQQGEANGGCGYIGLITANSYMKKEFGKKLIEEFFPKVDLTHVIDTSGMGPTLAGHATPTVILFGRNCKPVSEKIRAVLGIKGEPSEPEDHSHGRVWQSIIKQIDQSGAQDEYTSTVDIPRTTFANHPWSIGGGGATDVQELLNSNAVVVLDSLIEDIGFCALTRDDEVFLLTQKIAKRFGVEDHFVRRHITGENVRDWSVTGVEAALWPYNPESLNPELSRSTEPLLWPFRRQLCDRVAYGQSQIQRGLQWFEYSMFFKKRFLSPQQITFADVATHNHFVRCDGRNLFNVHAPIIILPPDATEDAYLALIGLLNSSTGCFWMKQVFQDKGSGGIGGGIGDEKWERRYELAGSSLRAFPIPEFKPLRIAGQLDSLARQLGDLLPETIIASNIPTAERLTESKIRVSLIRRQMLALQEELDWECYHLYSLLPDDVRYLGDDLPELALGQRAFEFVMARQMDKGELQTTWFERHGSTPIIEIPKQWPAAYRNVVERRIMLIETNKEIGLIEKPECKRRWNDEPWQDQQQRALRNWLLDRLESSRYWSDLKPHVPTLQSSAQLADKASGDHDFLQVAALYRGRSDFGVAALVNELVQSESVPFLPVLRYKPSGLRKREVWERTWDLQRREDAGEDVGDIPVPPKYTSADFLKQDYWRLRGKLDVPKERWISYPHLQTDSDPSLVVGWAGWDHLQQATALVSYYDARRREGWDAKRLTPILAGLDQLLPWIHQWHKEIDAEFGETAGQSYQTMLEHDAHELGLTLEDIRKWQPPLKGGKRKVAGEKRNAKR
jgi:hypothetical protein